jgi:hypothetical protein
MTSSRPPYLPMQIEDECGWPVSSTKTLMTGYSDFGAITARGREQPYSGDHPITRLQYAFGFFRNWTHDLLRGNAC